MSYPKFKVGDKVIFCGPIVCQEYFTNIELSHIKTYLNKTFTILRVKNIPTSDEFKNYGYSYVMKEVIDFCPFDCELKLVSYQLFLFEI